jgi:hypothetical protein
MNMHTTIIKGWRDSRLLHSPGSYNPRFAPAGIFPPGIRPLRLTPSLRLCSQGLLVAEWPSQHPGRNPVSFPPTFTSHGLPPGIAYIQAQSPPSPPPSQLSRLTDFHPLGWTPLGSSIPVQLNPGLIPPGTASKGICADGKDDQTREAGGRSSVMTSFIHDATHQWSSELFVLPSTSG